VAAFAERTEPTPRISCGIGVHVCFGTHLARLEMEVALNLLLDRLLDLRLDPEGDDPHIRGQVLRSPTSLPVLFGPPAGQDPPTAEGRVSGLGTEVV
jgi:cytochrome P450